MTKRVPQLVKGTDDYPLLLFHVDTNDTTNRNLSRIKEDFKALGVPAKKLVPKSSFPPFYQLEEGGQPETDALRILTPGFVAGAMVRVLAFVTMEHSSMIIIC